MLEMILKKFKRTIIFLGILYFVIALFLIDILKLTIDYSLFKIQNSGNFITFDYKLIKNGNKLYLRDLIIQGNDLYLASNNIVFDSSYFNIFKLPSVMVDELIVILEDNFRSSNLSLWNFIIPQVKINKISLTSKFKAKKLQTYLIENSFISRNEGNLKINAEKFYNAQFPSEIFHIHADLNPNGKIIASDNESYFNLIMKQINPVEFTYDGDIHISSKKNRSLINNLTESMGIYSASFEGDIKFKLEKGRINHSFDNFIITSNYFPLSYTLNGNNDNIDIIENGDKNNHGKISWEFEYYKLNIKEFSLPLFGGHLNFSQPTDVIIPKLIFDYKVPFKLENIDLSKVLYKNFTAEGIAEGQGTFNFFNMVIDRMELTPTKNSIIYCSSQQMSKEQFKKISLSFFPVTFFQNKEIGEVAITMEPVSKKQTISFHYDYFKNK